MRGQVAGGGDPLKPAERAALGQGDPLQARPAGSFKIDQLLQDDNLILFQIESFLHQLQGWMLEVLPEPAEEKTASEF